MEGVERERLYREAHDCLDKINELLDAVKHAMFEAEMADRKRQYAVAGNEISSNKFMECSTNE